MVRYVCGRPCPASLPRKVTGRVGSIPPRPTRPTCELPYGRVARYCGARTRRSRLNAREARKETEMAERRGWLAMFVGSVLLVAPGALAARAAAADGKPVAGARSLGDPLLPQIGNGGYDVQHYRIALDYDPATNTFDEGRRRSPPSRDQKLTSSASTSRTWTCPRVTVNGVEAKFEQVDATPELSQDPEVTQPKKLVVVPAPRPGRRGVASSWSRSPTAACRAVHRPGHVVRGLDPRLLPARPASDLRRRVRRQRADGRAELVPLQQLPHRQGDLRHR